MAAGDLEDVLLTAWRGIIDLTEDEIAFVRSSPVWPTRLAAVPMLPREVRAEVDWTYQPGQFDAVARTLLLAGAESPPAQQEATQRAAAAIPGARVRTLDGHSHIEHRVDPAMVAAIVCGFAAEV